MRYLALACDYDGTLAQHGRVDDATVAGLERVLATGRKLVMVTGRELDELHATAVLPMPGTDAGPRIAKSSTAGSK